MDAPEDAASPGSASPAPAVGAAPKPAAYRVLARKYRPLTFDDLVGQEAMVRTLSNAFDTGRIAQGYMLTGVRGVGKTTTARILARALNYEIPGKVDRPTIHMPELGVHCQAIMEGRHVDVIEMDAASHTGIADIREITDAARYKPVSARMKVYIIDEVHMLSTAAFNGLLKTLEEPPEHVKFIFATTEIRKVPITVLSRCQRFDLRRIDAEALIGLLRRIAGAEAVDVDDDALRLIARAGEGSARDSLSLLDQAIAQGAGRVDAETVRVMLGLADRSRVIDLFEHVMKGDAAAALGELAAQYAVGADPSVVLADLAEFCHFVTRLKIVGEAAIDLTVAETEAVRGGAFAEALSLRVLGRAWQILLKGLDEVRAAPKPLAAAEMVLIRLCYAADLPTPDEALRLIGQPAGPAGAGGPGGGPGGGSGGGSGGGGRPSALSFAAAAEGRVAALGGGGLAPASRPSARLAAAPEAGPYVDNVVPFVAPAAAMPVAAPETVAEPDAPPADAPAGVTPIAAPPRRREAEPFIPVANLEAVAALAAERRDLPLKVAIERQMRLVKFEDGRIEIALTPDAPHELPQDLGRKLSEWTNRRWLVVVSRETGAPTIAETRAKLRADLVQDARADPTVAALLARFPGAKVVDVRVQISADEERLRAAPKTAEGDAMFDAVPAPIDPEDDPGWSPDD
jgi:DNA polymerase-3 subunit gamma/tau